MVTRLVVQLLSAIRSIGFGPVIQLAGIGLVAAGIAMFSVPVSLIVLGALLILIVERQASA